MFIFLKAIISALTIIVITSIAKKTSILGGLIAMMPINIILSIIWLYFEKRDMTLLENFTKSALVGVMPTVLFLIVVIFLMNKDLKLHTVLLGGICFLFCAVMIQYKLMKII